MNMDALATNHNKITSPFGMGVGGSVEIKAPSALAHAPVVTIVNCGLKGITLTSHMTVLQGGVIGIFTNCDAGAAVGQSSRKNHIEIGSDLTYSPSVLNLFDSNYLVSSPKLEPFPTSFAPTTVEMVMSAGKQDQKKPAQFGTVIPKVEFLNSRETKELSDVQSISAEVIAFVTVKGNREIFIKTVSEYSKRLGGVKVSVQLISDPETGNERVVVTALNVSLGYREIKELKSKIGGIRYLRSVATFTI